MSTPDPIQTNDDASKRDVASTRRALALEASARRWLALLIDGTEAHTDNRLALEMQVDVRTVRRWVAGTLRPAASSIAHMRAIYLCRVAAPGAAWRLWADTDEEFAGVVAGLQLVAREPIDVAMRAARRVTAASVTREGISGLGAKPWVP